MREITSLIVHCTDTPTGRLTTVEDIDSWHIDRGFKRSDTYRLPFNPQLKAIGYHFVIYVDGSVHTGRQVCEIGAHVSGMNSNSIGISLVGSGTYNQDQLDALKELVSNLKRTYPKAKVIGHRDCPSGIAQGKDCPKFDVASWWKNGYIG